MTLSGSHTAIAHFEYFTKVKGARNPGVLFSRTKPSLLQLPAAGILLKLETFAKKARCVLLDLFGSGCKQGDRREIC